MRVVIIGAGLSGLSLANFLTRLNIDCIVLEQSPKNVSKVENSPYVLYANALSCFKAFNMEEVYEPRHTGFFPETHFGIMNHRQEWLLKFRNHEVQLKAMGEEDCVPLTTAPPANSESIVSRRLLEEKKIEMGRVPLRITLPASHLLETLQRAVRIKFNCQVVDLTPDDVGVSGGVNVIMEDGSCEHGDVVVGADGMHSTVRKLLNPDEFIGTSMSSAGMMHITGFACREQCPRGMEHPVEMWGNRRCLQTFPMHLVGENKVFFSATLPVLPKEVVSLHTMENSEDVDESELRQVFRNVLRKEFQDFGQEVVATLGEAELAIPMEMIEVPVMLRWFNKRAVLMGEAAHGAMPSFLQQDASLCVEDAAILATALLDVPLFRDSGFAYAFQRYESVRRERVERYLRQSRRARRFSFTSYELTRNTLLQCIPSVVMRLGQRWLSQWTYSAQTLEVDPKIKVETAFR